MKRQAWLYFWLVGVIWGSSFLLIRVGVEQLRPIEIVFIRTAIAAVGLNAVIVLRGVSFPRDWRTIRSIIIIGLGNVVAPFLLITWGEQFVPSGIAAVLQSTAALFTLVVAHFAFIDERMNIRKVIGLILGFIGVIVLFSSELTPERLNVATPEQQGTSPVIGGLAVVVASFFYATFTSFSRKVIQGQVAPIVMAGGTMAVAALATAPLAFLTEGGFTPLSTLDGQIIGSVLLLGFLNTFIAYLFYYSVVQELGAARASMVTYIVPPVGVVLGALVLQEPVGITLLIGAGLIFSGIAIVNVKLSRFAREQREARAEG